jgi:hypothetical protein
METLLTFTVCAKYITDRNAGGKKMLKIKHVQYSDKTAFLAEDIDGDKDILVMKNPYYDPNSKSFDTKENYKYWINTIDRDYYLDIDL